ncbi:MAG: hypothetical protein ACLQVD_13965 [Capsulimonadaceae bacterium]
MTVPIVVLISAVFAVIFTLGGAWYLVRARRIRSWGKAIAFGISSIIFGLIFTLSALHKLYGWSLSQIVIAGVALTGLSAGLYAFAVSNDRR